MATDRAFTLGYRPALDGLRAVAIALVMWAHAVGILLHRRLTVGLGGLLGVDLFFVLSGFLITSLLIERRRPNGQTDLPDFYRRRVLRLFPALYVFLAVDFVVALWAQRDLGDEVRSLIASLTYSNNWAAVAGVDLAQSQRHLWSLAVEEQFYLVWPVVVAVVLRLRRPAVWLAAAVGTVALWRLVLSADRLGGALYGVYVRTDARADGLLAGALLAAAVHRGWRVSRRAAAVMAGVGTVVVAYFFLTTYAVHPRLYQGGFTLVALGSCGLIVAALDGESRWGRALSHPAAVWVGRRSYSLYLWHLLAFELAASIFPGSFVARVVVVFAGAFGFAAASFRFVERPFLELRLRPARPASRAAARRPRWAVATAYASVTAVVLGGAGTAAALIARERSGGVVGGEAAAAAAIAPLADPAATPASAPITTAGVGDGGGSTTTVAAAASTEPAAPVTTVVDAVGTVERLASVLDVLPPGPPGPPTPSLDVPVPLAAVLHDAFGAPLAGRRVVLELRSGASAAVCQAATDIAGRAMCVVEADPQVTTTSTPQDAQVVGRFDGDAGYLPVVATWP